REQLSEEQLVKKTAESSVLKALIAKEIRQLVRPPVYLMNGVLTIFIIPVMLCIPAISQPGFLQQIRQFGDMLQSSEGIGGFVLAGGFALFMFIAGTNSVSSTVLSREGRTLFVSKYLPITYRDL